MKTFCALILFVSSWYSTDGCRLTSCAGASFQNCPGWTDDSCRKLTTLNLAAKGLNGPVPFRIYQLYGTNINGNADDGISKVALQKVYLQQNQLSGSIGAIIDCPTIKEINVEGNAGMTSNQKITKPNTNLEILNVGGTSQTNLNWLDNTKIPNLKTLKLANNQLTNAGILAITKLTKLTELDLSGNNQITDLTALAVLTNLKTIKVDQESLKTQVTILTSGASPDTKRSQLVSNKINEIQLLAQGNIGEIQTLKDSVGGSMQTLTTYSENLEERVAELELKLSQLNQACFAANLNQNSNSQGQRTPGFNVDAPPNDDSASFTSGGRRLADDCIKKDPKVGAVNGSATGLISIAASTIAALFL